MGLQANKPADLIQEASLIANKLTARSERSVAKLAIGQAQIRLGRKSQALASLTDGWKYWTTGSDQSMSEGDRSDAFTLIVEGDFATLPVQYGEAFLRAGSLADAKKAADALGDSPLGKAFRHDLGLRIRKDFPEAFEELTFTDGDRKIRETQRQAAMAEVEKAKDEPDLTKRAYIYAQSADRLAILNTPKPSADAWRSAIALAPNVSVLGDRIGLITRSAYGLWNLDQKEEARKVLAEAIKLDNTLQGKSKEILRIHFFVEEIKQTFEMPNRLDEITKALNEAEGVLPAPSAPAATSPSTSGASPFDKLAKAETLAAKGDKAAALKLLKNLGATLTAKNDPDGTIQVMVGDQLLTLGDKANAKMNLNIAAARFVSTLKPYDYLPAEDFMRLTQIAQKQAAANDRVAGVQTLVKGIRKFSAGPDTAKISHFGSGKTKEVIHDRKSAVLHHGAIALAKIGGITEAVTMARSIPNAAHRAIALAGIAQESPQS